MINTQNTKRGYLHNRTAFVAMCLATVFFLGAPFVFAGSSGSSGGSGSSGSSGSSGGWTTYTTPGSGTMNSYYATRQYSEYSLHRGVSNISYTYHSGPGLSGGYSITGYYGEGGSSAGSGGYRGGGYNCRTRTFYEGAGSYREDVVCDPVSNNENGGNGGNSGDGGNGGGSSGPPTANLEVQNTTTGSNWTTDDIQILDGHDEIALRWSSSNANECDGNSFPTGSGSPTDGTTNTVTEPSGPNSSTTYSVTCSNSSRSTESNSIKVTAISNAVDLTANKTIVQRGDSVILTWDTMNNDPANCTLEGPGLSISPVTTKEGNTEVPIEGQSTFVLSCDSGGRDDTTIRTAPEIIET